MTALRSEQTRTKAHMNAMARRLPMNRIGSQIFLVTALLTFPALVQASQGQSEEIQVRLPDGDGWASFIIAPDASYRITFEVDVTFGEMSYYLAYDYNWTDPYANQDGGTPWPINRDGGAILGKAGYHARVREPAQIHFEGGSLNDSTTPERRTARFDLTEWDLPRGFLLMMAGNGSFENFRLLTGTVKASQAGEDAVMAHLTDFETYPPPSLSLRLPGVGSRRIMEPFTVELNASRPFFGAVRANETVEPDGTRLGTAQYKTWQEGGFRASRAGSYTLNFDGREAGDLAYWAVFPIYVTGPLGWWTPPS